MLGDAGECVVVSTYRRTGHRDLQLWDFTERTTADGPPHRPVCTPAACRLCISPSSVLLSRCPDAYTTAERDCFAHSAYSLWSPGCSRCTASRPTTTPQWPCLVRRWS